VAAAPSNGSSNGATPTPTKQAPEPGEPVSVENAKLRTLVPATADVAKKLVTTLAKGDVSAAEKLFVRSEELDKLLKQGQRAVLGGHLVIGNKKELEDLGQVLKGKMPQHTFEPGAISWSPSSAFQTGIPVMSNAVVEVQVDGLSLRLKLELAYIENHWFIFTLTDAHE